jgi:hypothetical protein
VAGTEKKPALGVGRLLSQFRLQDAEGNLRAASPQVFKGLQSGQLLLLRERRRANYEITIVKVVDLISQPCAFSIRSGEESFHICAARGAWATSAEARLSISYDGVADNIGSAADRIILAARHGEIEIYLDLSTGPVGYGELTAGKLAYAQTIASLNESRPS